jgi:hypothetical protein
MHVKTGSETNPAVAFAAKTLQRVATQSQQ